MRFQQHCQSQQQACSNQNLVPVRISIAIRFLPARGTALPILAKLRNILLLLINKAIRTELVQKRLEIDESKQQPRCKRERSDPSMQQIRESGSIRLK